MQIPQPCPFSLVKSTIFFEKEFGDEYLKVFVLLNEHKLDLGFIFFKLTMYANNK
jgi:hypothetical protein